jgi:hypothetical protein
MQKAKMVMENQIKMKQLGLTVTEEAEKDESLDS